MQEKRAAEPAGGPDLDVPLTVALLVEAEHISSAKAVYEGIYNGMPHLRRGRAIRVTRRQWREWWGAGRVAEGVYKVDPVRSQKALQRAERRVAVAK